MINWVLTIKTDSGRLARTVVAAETRQLATDLAETLYGADRIVRPPRQEETQGEANG